VLVPVEPRQLLLHLTEVIYNMLPFRNGKFSYGCATELHSVESAVLPQSVCQAYGKQLASKRGLPCV
jgi:hypothetical protein